MKVFVGTTNGGIFRSIDGGVTWSANLAGPEIPGRLISHLETHPKSADQVIATVAGTGRVARIVPRGVNPAIEAEPFWHVFFSGDAGLNWRRIDSVYMPDVAYHDACFETKPPYRLFVAGDCGVWMTSDYRSWVDLTGGLPTVIASGIVYHPDGILTASTYGRGIWRLRVREIKKQGSISARL